MARLNTANSANGDEHNKPPHRRTPTSQARQFQAASERQQRPLKLQHVDSLLLPKLMGSSKSSSTPVRPLQSSQKQNSQRSTPARRTKQGINYIGHSDSGVDSERELELVDSEWNHSESNSSDGDSIDDGDSWLFPVSAVGTDNTRQQAQPFYHRLNPRGHGRATGMINQYKGSSASVLETDYLCESRTSSIRPSTSSGDESGAILRYSPPRSTRPLKKPPVNRPRTPTPPQSPARSRLTSPKKLQKIPPTPHRPSTDAFWNAEVVNTWNDEYSPRKPLKSPRKLVLCDSSDDEDTFTPRPTAHKSPAKHSANKDKQRAAELKKVFERSKHSVAESFLQELDSKITEGEIGQLAASTGGVKIIWSKKLNSTAGRAHWRREAVKLSKPGSVSGLTLDEARAAAGDGTLKPSYRHHASIELAEKVIDDETRLLNVLAHEYCHLANFMISGVKDQPHGASFKRWAALASKAFADRAVVVTTKHSYEITYKYAWACCNADCGVEYARHSRSIDPKRHTCGKCRGRLEQIRPVPRRGGAGRDVQGLGGKTEYQQFVKEQFRLVRNELGQKSPMKDVMREVGARYRRRKNGSAREDEEDAIREGNNAAAEGVDVVQIDDSDDDCEGMEGAEPRSRAEIDGDGDINKISSVLDFLTLRDG